MYMYVFDIVILTIVIPISGLCSIIVGIIIGIS